MRIVRLGRVIEPWLQRRQRRLVFLLFLVDLGLGLLVGADLGGQVLKLRIGLVVVAGLRRRLHRGPGLRDLLQLRFDLGVGRVAHQHRVEPWLQRRQRRLVCLLFLVDLGLGLLVGADLHREVLRLRQRLGEVLALRRRLHLGPRGVELLLHRLQLRVLRLRYRHRIQSRLQLRPCLVERLLLPHELVVPGLERLVLGLAVGERLVRAGIVTRVGQRRRLGLRLTDRGPVRVQRLKGRLGLRRGHFLRALAVGEVVLALRVVGELVQLVDRSLGRADLLEPADEVLGVGLALGLLDRRVGLAGQGRHRLRRPLGRFQRIQARRLLGDLLLVLRLGFLLPKVLFVDRRKLGQQLIERIGGLGVLALVDLLANAVQQATQCGRLCVFPGFELLDLAHRVVELALARVPVCFCLFRLLAEGRHLAAQRPGVAEHLVDASLPLGRVVAVDLGKRGLERPEHRVAPRRQGLVARGLCIDRGVLKVAVDEALFLLERGLEVLGLLVRAAALSVRGVLARGLRVTDAELALQACVAVAHAASSGCRSHQRLAQVRQGLHDGCVHRHVGELLLVDGSHDAVAGDVSLIAFENLARACRQLTQFSLIAQRRRRVLIQRVAQLVVQVVQDGVDLLAAGNNLRKLFGVCHISHAHAVLDLLQVLLCADLHGDPGGARALELPTPVFERLDLSRRGGRVGRVGRKSRARGGRLGCLLGRAGRRGRPRQFGRPVGGRRFVIIMVMAVVATALAIGRIGARGGDARAAQHDTEINQPLTLRCVELPHNNPSLCQLVHAQVRLLKQRCIDELGHASHFRIQHEGRRLRLEAAMPG